MHYVYVIKSSQFGSYYIGSTGNLFKRLEEHNKNRSKFTKNKGPWQLVYKEKVNTKASALKREKQIKSYKGGNCFKKLISASPSSSLA